MDNTHEEQKPITLDELAGMVQRGFEKTATKEETATKEGIVSLKKDLATFKQETADNFTHVNARLAIIETDVKGIVYRDEFDDLMARVKLLETREGIVSGK